MKFLKQFSLTFGNNIAVLVISILNNAFITRYIGVEARGVYAIVISSTLIISMLLASWLSFSSTCLIGKERKNLSKILSNAFLYVLLLSILFTLTYLIYPNFLEPLTQDVSTFITLIITISIPLLVFRNVVITIFLGLQRITEYNIIPTIAILITFILNMIVLYAFNLGLNEVLIIWVLSSIGVITASLTVIFKTETIKFKPDIKALKETFSIGWKSMSSNILGILILRSDIFIINYFIGIKAVGIYSIAVVMAEIILKVPSNAAVLIFSRVANWGKNEKSSNLTSTVIRNTLPISFLLICFFLFFGYYIILFLFGEQFGLSYIPLCFLLPGIFFLSILTILNNYFAGLQYPLITVYSPLVAFLTNLILNFLLIPKYGINGAAIASSIAYFSWLIIIFSKFKSQTDYSIYDILIMNKADFQLWSGVCKKVFLKIKDSK